MRINEVQIISSRMRNDPSAGSPTDALLRLLFPLDHTVRLSFHRIQAEARAPVPQTHREVHR